MPLGGKEFQFSNMELKLTNTVDPDQAQHSGSNLFAKVISR